MSRVVFRRVFYHYELLLLFLWFLLFCLTNRLRLPRFNHTVITCSTSPYLSLSHTHTPTSSTPIFSVHSRSNHRAPICFVLKESRKCLRTSQVVTSATSTHGVTNVHHKPQRKLSAHLPCVMTSYTGGSYSKHTYYISGIRNYKHTHTHTQHGLYESSQKRLDVVSNCYLILIIASYVGKTWCVCVAWS